MKFSYYARLSYEDYGVSVFFPDIPGCFTCGETKDEAIAMAKDVLVLYFKGETTLPKANSVEDLENKPDLQMDPEDLQYENSHEFVLIEV